jgi:hypothetical protein
MGYNLVLFYYLSASGMWPDKTGVFDGSGLIRESLMYCIRLFFKIQLPTIFLFYCNCQFYDTVKHKVVSSTQSPWLRVVMPQ